MHTFLVEKSMKIVSKKFLRSLGLTALGVTAFSLSAALSWGQSPSFSLLYSFHGKTGANPLAPPIADAQGNLYGTTQDGGAHGLGTVYEITASGEETVLHSFKAAPDGNLPLSNLVLDADGNLFGTTTQGGQYGFGTVFEVSAAGKESVLYSFTGVNGDGRNPVAGLLLANDGSFCGTTQSGGKFNFGTVFKVDSTGAETVLYSFKGFPSDGAYPLAGVIADDAGNLYGTTQVGGRHSDGVVFELAASGKEKVLYHFTGGRGGAYPFGGVVLDEKGNLFGTTAYGGEGVGMVYKVNSEGVENMVYAFNGSNGAYPSAGLVRDAQGNLYGTAEFGGKFGGGIVFEVTHGTAILLHSFDGGDGKYLLSGLSIDASGNLYGTAPQGGGADQGTAYKLTP